MRGVIWPHRLVERLHGTQTPFCAVSGPFTQLKAPRTPQARTTKPFPLHLPARCCSATGAQRWWQHVLNTGLEDSLGSAGSNMAGSGAPSPAIAHTYAGGVTWRVVVACIIGSFSGFLMGYDNGIAGGEGVRLPSPSRWASVPRARVTPPPPAAARRRRRDVLLPTALLPQHPQRREQHGDHQQGGILQGAHARTLGLARGTRPCSAALPSCPALPCAHCLTIPRRCLNP